MSPPPQPAPDVVRRIDYDAHGKLRYRPEYALFGDGPGVYPVTFQFLGGFFPKSVRMHMVDGGEAREIVYSPDYFTVTDDSPARELPPGTNGFAGFWIQESRLQGDWRQREPWATFLGASYFRAVGEQGQVGMSARGLALNVASSMPEEFPDFVAHWISPAASESDPVVVHSLLDGPSICGAYRFLIYRDHAVVMDIENHLFLRQDIERMGIAPLTSMFWYAEYGREKIADWRPGGPRFRRARDLERRRRADLAARSTTRPGSSTPAISTRRPEGFGLIQRDRVFDHYLDGVGYDRRPSTWVEPLGDWGKGMVQLVEIPTDDEIHDNIAAYWLTDRPTRAGDAFNYHYRLHWVKDQPFFPGDQLARVVATRMGRGGQPGKPRPRGVYKISRRVPGRHPGQPALRRPAGAGDLGRPRHHLADPDGGGARRRARATGACSSTSRSRGRSRSTCACSCARATPCSARPGSICSSPARCAHLAGLNRSPVC